MKPIMRNEMAQAGVGTLIIFIAMVLVAAVAAAVLIQTSGVMQSKATTTTKEAGAAIAENIVIDSMEGNRTNSTAPDISLLNVTVKLAAGGSDIDITKLLVTVKSGTATGNYNYSATALSATQFRVVQMRGSSAGTLYQYSDLPNPALKAGDLVKIVIYATPLNLQTKGLLSVTIVPEKGASINLPVTLPAFGDDTSITIFP